MLFDAVLRANPEAHLATRSDRGPDSVFTLFGPHGIQSPQVEQNILATGRFAVRMQSPDDSNSRATVLGENPQHVIFQLRLISTLGKEALIATKVLH